jgi:hypothetical protein
MPSPACFCAVTLSFLDFTDAPVSNDLAILLRIIPHAEKVLHPPSFPGKLSRLRPQFDVLMGSIKLVRCPESSEPPAFESKSNLRRLRRDQSLFEYLRDRAQKLGSTRNGFESIQEYFTVVKDLPDISHCSRLPTSLSHENK